MLHTIVRAIFAIMSITNLISIFMFITKNKCEKVAAFTSAFIWCQGFIHCTLYAILGEF